MREFCRICDLNIVDGLVDLWARSPGWRACVPAHSERLVQFYALAMVLGLVVFLLALLRHRGSLKSDRAEHLENRKRKVLSCRGS